MVDVFGNGRGSSDDAVIKAAARRARDEVQTMRQMAAGMLLRTYRSYLQATVSFVSPVLIRALERDGIELADALATLRPPPGWPDPAGSAQVFRYSVLDDYGSAPRGPRPRRPPPDLQEERARHCDMAPGSVLRGPLHPDGLLTIRVVGRSLEVAMGLGGRGLTTGRGLGYLTVTGPRPIKLVAAVIGRPIEQVVDHPLLHRQSWTVDRVDRRAGSRGSWTLVFATGIETLTLPWGA